MSPAVHGNWQLSVCQPRQFSPSLLGQLQEVRQQIRQENPDAARVDLHNFPVSWLDELVDYLTSEDREPFAHVIDPDRRVTYRARVGRGKDRVWLRSVEVEPMDDDADPALFRVPAKVLAHMAAHALDQETPLGSLIRRAVEGAPLGTNTAPPMTRGERPTPELLRELVRQGYDRRTLATHFDRTIGRIDVWLREAREARPDLDWPTPRRTGRRSPTTQTAGTDQAPATDTEPKK